MACVEAKEGRRGVGDVDTIKLCGDGLEAGDTRNTRTCGQASEDEGERAMKTLKDEKPLLLCSMRRRGGRQTTRQKTAKQTDEY